MGYPANYRYTKEHEWIALDGKIGTIGITLLWMKLFPPLLQVRSFERE